MAEQITFQLALVLFVGIACQWVAWRRMLLGFEFRMALLPLATLSSSGEIEFLEAGGKPSLRVGTRPMVLQRAPTEE